MRDVDIGDLRVDPSGWHIMTVRYEGGELILHSEYHRTASQDQEAANAFRPLEYTHADQQLGKMGQRSMATYISICGFRFRAVAS
jgi:hypothetical protein